MRRDTFHPFGPVQPEARQAARYLALLFRQRVLIVTDVHALGTVRVGETQFVHTMTIVAPHNHTFAAAADQGLAAVVERVREADARTDVVLVDGKRGGIPEERIPRLVERNELEIVAD